MCVFNPLELQPKSRGDENELLISGSMGTDQTPSKSASDLEAFFLLASLTHVHYETHVVRHFLTICLSYVLYPRSEPDPTPNDCACMVWYGVVCCGVVCMYADIDGFQIGGSMAPDQTPSKPASDLQAFCLLF
jgi:hypothetical protein